MMTCEQAAATELAARYVSGQLGPDERDSYEQHYFECARCFEEVRLQMSMHAALKNAPKHEPSRVHKPWVAWGAIAATVFVMASIGFYLLRPAAVVAPVASAAPQPDPLELLA